MHGKKVLIVEDSFLIAASLAAALNDDGFTVVGVVDTADCAIRLIEGQPPDGVLLDVRLREGSAVQVAEALQRRRVPFVVISGYARDTLPSELKAAPYVAKPMSESELMRATRGAFIS